MTVTGNTDGRCGRRPAQLFGPLISAGDIADHRRLFTGVFGMEDEGAVLIDTESAILFGSEAPKMEIAVLRTPGVSAGAIVCQFDPVSAETVRTYESRVDRDAFKVIDFYAPDYRAAIERARALGYRVVEAEAEYELPGGTFREAHLWGPDNVVTAFLGGPSGFFADFAQVTDRMVSEVQSISAPVSAGDPVVAFYADVFGWQVVYEYGIDDPSVSDLLGVDEPVRLRTRSMGTSTREPYIGLMDYGLPPAVGGSLLGRPAAPRRGLLGAVVLVDDLYAVLAAADATGDPVVTLDLPHFGAVRASVMLPPHRVPHLLLEAQNASR